jgi:hypothetical protein
MDKEKEENKPADNAAGKTFSSADIKNAHAAGDGAIEKSDESVDRTIENGEEQKPDPAY